MHKDLGRNAPSFSVNTGVTCIGCVKAAGERLHISIHLFKAYAQTATNDSDIARNIHE